MIFPRVMSVMDSIMPNFRRRNEVILLALASLAGTLGFALFWLTTVWKINMPWNQGLEMRGPFGLACLVLLLLAVAGAWLRHSVPGPKAWLLLGIASLLCFTGSAALSMHGILFDPLSAALSLLLGGAVAWWWDRRSNERPASLQKILAGQLSDVSVKILDEELPEPPLAFKQRSLFVLTCCLKDAARLRKKLGPFEFLTLTTEFRRLSTALLMTRQALVLPGSGETVQACFGVPVAGEEDGPWAAETSRLLEFALKDFCPTEAAGILKCGFSLIYGEAITGMGETSYEVSGDILAAARIAAEQAPENHIVSDATTAAWLPAPVAAPEPEIVIPSSTKKAAAARKKPAARKTTPAVASIPKPAVPKKRAPKKTKATAPKGSKKKTSEEN